MTIKKTKFSEYIISINTPIITAIIKIQNNPRDDLLVEKEGKIIGTISSGDLLRAILEKKNLDTSIRTAVNYNFKFLKKKSYSDAKKIFLSYGINLIPILDKNFKLKSIIKLNEILGKN